MYAEKLFRYRDKPKKMWDILKEATVGPSIKNSITEINANGSKLTNDEDMANEFNNFFTSIGKTISNSVNPTTTDPLQYLNLPNDTPDIEFSNTSSDQIFGLIKNFDNKTSIDLDDISIMLIKKVSHEICSLLVHIFNLSLQQGCFPNSFKTTRTVPIFKTGDLSLCDNYRTISLVKTLSKILEKIMQIKLINHSKLTG
jgi:hypothetical protein